MMNTRQRLLAFATAAWLFAWTLHHVAVAGDTRPDDRVPAATLEVVLPTGAGELEKFAAAELQRYLQRLLAASARIVSKPSDAAEGWFFLGTSAHAAAATSATGAMPSLGDQGFLLRKTTYRHKPAMVIIGGSPAALVWGVYELVERYGVAYLLSGDVYPEKRKTFSLPEIDRVFEPIFKARWFRTMGDFAMGMEGWGMADYRPLLDQLTKLKFNRIRIAGCSPAAPFLDLQLKGVRQQSAVLFYGEHYPITADMPGRRLFGNETEFWNPDLPPPQSSYEQLAAAGRRHVHALIAYAHSRGIEASSVWSITECCLPRQGRLGWQDNAKGSVC